jgi:hypothetical protein
MKISSNRFNVWLKGASIGLLVMALAGCGSIGGGSSKPTAVPTATVWPTVAVQNVPTASPFPATPVVQSSPIATQVGLLTTPLPGSPVASPAGSASPVAAVVPTTAATIRTPPVGASTPRAATAVASPAASPTAATPAASTVVTSCNPDVIPPFTGKSPDYVTTVDLHFRAGPGSDCDTIGDVLVGGTSLTVLSDPVTRKGEDGQWVQVNVDGQLGWVSSDYIEPASGS